MSEVGVIDEDRRIGRYSLRTLVGRGGMAEVWAAHDGDEIVALKIILPALRADPRFEKMFLAEARLTSTIHHPHVCAVRASGESDGVLYLAMEWVTGESLAGLMEMCGAPLDGALAARIVIDAARGLHAAHQATGVDGTFLGLVHRDVSPQNILVSIDGVSKIADFGIAKIDGAPTTQAGFVKGKIAYMAPEQVYCEKVDVRTDVFSLGVVLYQVTTGVLPFRAPTDLAVLARLADSEEAEAPSTVLPDYPPELEAIVCKALAKEPAKRFATMDELAQALERLAVGVGAESVAAFVRATCGAKIAEQSRAIDCAAVLRSAAVTGYLRGGGRGRARVAAFIALVVLIAASFSVLAWPRATKSSPVAVLEPRVMEGETSFPRVEPPPRSVLPVEAPAVGTASVAPPPALSSPRIARRADYPLARPSSTPVASERSPGASPMGVGVLETRE